MSAARNGSHACPACLKDARTFHELFRLPRRVPSRPRTKQVRSRGREADPAGAANGSIVPGLVLVPSHVIESWDAEKASEQVAPEARREPPQPEPAPAAAREGAEPPIASLEPAPVAAPAAPPASPADTVISDLPVVQASARAAERTSRHPRVVEAGTFRISRAQMAADVDEIREGRPAARSGNDADLVNDFLEHLANAETKTRHQN